jgi:hypothetical protein
MKWFWYWIVTPSSSSPGWNHQLLADLRMVDVAGTVHSARNIGKTMARSLYGYKKT